MRAVRATAQIQSCAGFFIVAETASASHVHNPCASRRLWYSTHKSTH